MMGVHDEENYIKFYNGYKMPLVGLGTWQGKPEETENAIEAALNCGYRHIDTAFNYRNEESIGISLQKWLKSGKGTRDDLFIVTKLPHVGMRASDVSKYLNWSLKRLQLDYVDLYLIHLPFGFIPDNTGETAALTDDGGPVLDLTTDHVAIWKAMEEEVKNGKIKSIGISNFNPSQITRIYDNATIKPTVLQIECHVTHQQKELRNFCTKYQLPVVAYSPLGSPQAAPHFLLKYGYESSQNLNILENPIVCEIATKYNKTSAQILLKHLVQQKIGVIPKSSSPQRIKLNINLFDFKLTEDEINKLNKLDLEDKGRIFDFKFFKNVETHPEYPF